MYESACPQSVQRPAEGRTARAIENQTSKLPSDLFLWSASGAMGLSCGLHAAGRKHLSLFIGQWAPPLLIMGLYNKLVKLHGSDTRGEDDRDYLDREASAETVVEMRTRFDDDRYEVEIVPARRHADADLEHAAEHDEDGAAYRQHAENEFGATGVPIGSSSMNSHVPPAYDPQSQLPRPLESRYQP